MLSQILREYSSASVQLVLGVQIVPSQGCLGQHRWRLWLASWAVANSSTLVYCVINILQPNWNMVNLSTGVYSVNSTLELTWNVVYFSIFLRRPLSFRRYSAAFWRAIILGSGSLTLELSTPLMISNILLSTRRTTFLQVIGGSGQSVPLCLLSACFVNCFSALEKDRRQR